MDTRESREGNRKSETLISRLLVVPYNVKNILPLRLIREEIQIQIIATFSTHTNKVEQRKRKDRSTGTKTFFLRTSTSRCVRHSTMMLCIQTSSTKTETIRQ